MTDGRADSPAASDRWREALLAGLLSSVRVRSSLFFRSALAAPWGFTLDLGAYYEALARFHGVDAQSAETGLHPGICRTPFHVVTEGSCWLEVNGLPGRVQLHAGDFVVFPRSFSHTMRDALTTPCRNFVDLLASHEPTSDGHPPMRSEFRVGGNGAVTRLVCGGMRFENVNINPLLAALPSIIHVKAGSNGGASWLRLTVEHILEQLGSDRPGHEAVVTRLADILFIGAVRSYFEESLASAESGWLAAVRDDQVGRAIALLHTYPARPWTVEALADRVALSRAAFASRFTQLVGEPPLRYLTQLRLDAAARRLRQTNDKLFVIASSAGYTSVAAFTRAFQRHLGMTPGEYRRVHAGS